MWPDLQFKLEWVILAGPKQLPKNWEKLDLEIGVRSSSIAPTASLQLYSLFSMNKLRYSRISLRDFKTRNQHL